MEQNKVLELKQYLEEKGEALPEFVEQNPTHWTARLYVANRLKKHNQVESVYKILREIYEENTFRYNKDIHAGYEDYIEEKVNFFKELADLSFKVTGEAKKSIPYLDEALIMLDGSESVNAYINPKEIQKLKEEFIAKMN